MNFERGQDIKKSLDIGLGEVLDVKSIRIKYFPNGPVRKVQEKELSVKQAEAVLRILSSGKISKEDRIQLITIDTRDIFPIKTIESIKYFIKKKKRRKMVWRPVSMYRDTWDIVFPQRDPDETIAYNGKFYNPVYPERNTERIRWGGNTAQTTWSTPVLLIPTVPQTQGLHPMNGPYYIRKPKK